MSLKSDPPACEVPPSSVLTTCDRFASGFDSFFFLGFEQSIFQYPTSLQYAHWFSFRSSRPSVLDFLKFPCPSIVRAIKLHNIDLRLVHGLHRRLINSNHISSKRCQTHCGKPNRNRSKLDKIESLSHSETLDEFLKWSTPTNLIPRPIQNATLRSTYDPTNNPNAASRLTQDLRQTNHGFLRIDTRSHTEPGMLWYHSLRPPEEFSLADH